VEEGEKGQEDGRGPEQEIRTAARAVCMRGGVGKGLSRGGRGGEVWDE
jgi:hypothetical protein